MKTLFRLFVIVYAGLAWAGPEGESIYQLELDLTDQAGEPIGLDVFKGQPVLVSMFYARCPHVCPMIISTIQMTEAELAPEQRERLRVLLVSLDPEHDTPERLAAAAAKQNVDTSRWKLARTDAAGVRQLAAVLGIRFRQRPDGEFNHTTLITLLDGGGVPVASADRLMHADPSILTAIDALPAAR